MKRILGVDPGLRITGYGAITCDGGALRVIEAGVITPDIADPLEKRLHTLHEQMLAIISTTNPDVMVIEKLWVSPKNPTTALLLGHARGVLCLAASEKGIMVAHLGHSLVKRGLTGSGGAPKEQVKRMVMHLLHLATPPQPDDVSDALALALAHVNRTGS